MAALTLEILIDLIQRRLRFLFTPHHPLANRPSQKNATQHGNNYLLRERRWLEEKNKSQNLFVIAWSRASRFGWLPFIHFVKLGHSNEVNFGREKEKLE